MAYLSAAILTTFVFMTMIRNETWRTEKTMWADVVSKNPRSIGGHINLGREYQLSGNVPKAIAEYQTAMDLAASKRDFRSRDLLALAQSNLGGLMIQQGDRYSAETTLRGALSLLPNYGPSVLWLSELYNKEGRYGESLGLIDNAISAGFGSGFTQKGRLYANKAIALCGIGQQQLANDFFVAARSNDADLPPMRCEESR